MPVSEHLLVELVHDVFYIKLHLSDLALGELVSRLLSHKEVDPLLNNWRALEGGRKVRVTINCELDVSHVRGKLVNCTKVKWKRIDSRYNFLGDVEHALTLKSLDQRNFFTRFLS